MGSEGVSERNLERSARRLVHLYPSEWRRRFGDEFEQLLIDEMRHRWSARRAANVVGHAVLAHLTVAGMVGRTLAPQVQAWRAVRVLGMVVVMFLAIGIGMWSQLAVGWTWASPTSAGTRTALWLMSGTLLGLSGMFALALIVLIWPIARRGRRPVGPLLALGGCGTALWIGCVHVAAQWPATATSGWETRTIVPAGLGRIGWAGTLWLSAYWVHPGMLLALPADVLAWMMISPLLLTGLAAAGLATVRHSVPTTGLLRALACVGAVSVVLAALFVAGAAAWILSSGSGPRELFQAGSLDDGGLVLLVGAVLTAAHLARRALLVADRPHST